MNILTKINWVDVLIVIIMVRTTYVAFKDGLSHEIFPLIGAACTLILGLHYYDKLASFLANNLINIDIHILEFLSFTTLVIVIAILFKFARLLLDKIIKVTWHPFIEKFGGLLAGIFRGLLITGTVLIILALIPLPYLQWSIRDRSLTGKYFFQIGPELYGRAHNFFPTAMAGGSTVDKDSLKRKLISDKAIAPPAVKARARSAEWDKAAQL